MNEFQFLAKTPTEIRLFIIWKKFNKQYQHITVNKNILNKIDPYNLGETEYVCVMDSRYNIMFLRCDCDSSKFKQLYDMLTEQFPPKTLIYVKRL